jgi:co-chaperonin GroES (HSP10)
MVASLITDSRPSMVTNCLIVKERKEEGGMPISQTNKEDRKGGKMIKVRKAYRYERNNFPHVHVHVHIMTT